MDKFSDYIVYVDESGDHSLTKIDTSFPVFCLTFCVVRKEDYYNQIVPAFQKFKFWGHDGIVLHERDIRKSTGSFAILLTNKGLRDSFYAQLNDLMDQANISIFTAIIDKKKLKKQYKTPWNPYEIALRLCMEELFDFLFRKGQYRRTVHVIFESRGKKEDEELELEFRRICGNQNKWGYKKTDFSMMAFEPVFQKKAFNSTGLQLADLTARPVAINTIRPGQANRAYEIIRGKLMVQKCFP